MLRQPALLRHLHPPFHIVLIIVAVLPPPASHLLPLTCHLHLPPTIFHLLVSMFFSNLVLAGAALAGLVAAQQSPYVVDPASIDKDLRQAWCRSQVNKCPLICGGQASPNTCDQVSLSPPFVLFTFIHVALLPLHHRPPPVPLRPGSRMSRLTVIRNRTHSCGCAPAPMAKCQTSPTTPTQSHTTCAPNGKRDA